MLDRVGRTSDDKFHCLAGLIGNTPMLRIKLRCAGKDITVYAKAEMYNFSGSIKDRMALNILRNATRSGALKPGQRIAEATSGNAGIAIAALGTALGHPVTIFMPDWMSVERRAILASHGAEIRLVSKEEGGFLGSIAMAEALGKNAGAFLPRQFSNEDNCSAHCQGTAPEIWNQVTPDGGQIGGFVAGVGTGGTVMGVGRFLKERDAGISVHPVEPVESPTLSTGHKVGHHRIQGVSDEFIPEIVKLDQVDAVIGVNDGDSILMAQKLCKQLGLGVGISSGGNLIAAVRCALAQDAAAGADMRAVATVFPDSNSKYLSTDLAKEEPCRDGYLTPQIELVDMQTIR
ncbi:cysteine synthase [Sphingopyxis sp. BSNA05]|uniref:PLP-dependent cysteine synthase family protein n=1 Tax=Sphingopyxis sp. BSNA05 TaxID=1236614 RepID=UPI00156560AC|nr:cysteine synthase family protein [Sphingopyxis sp. BSNA05]NRD89916.1 cysteine synthase [Sphingopyxis sp. BSNA05]